MKIYSLMKEDETPKMEVVYTINLRQTFIAKLTEPIYGYQEAWKS